MQIKQGWTERNRQRIEKEKEEERLRKEAEKILKQREELARKEQALQIKKDLQEKKRLAQEAAEAQGGKKARAPPKRLRPGHQLPGRLQHGQRAGADAVGQVPLQRLPNHFLS